MEVGPSTWIMERPSPMVWLHGPWCKPTLNLVKIVLSCSCVLDGVKQPIHSFLGGKGFRHPTRFECMEWSAQIMCVGVTCYLSPSHMQCILLPSICNLGEPTHTLVPCWMPKPLPRRNECTGCFAPLYPKALQWEGRRRLIFKWFGWTNPYTCSLLDT